MPGMRAFGKCFMLALIFFFFSYCLQTLVKEGRNVQIDDKLLSTFDIAPEFRLEVVRSTLHQSPFANKCALVQQTE